MENDTILTDNNDILQEVKNFYEKLYERRDVEDCEVPQMVTEIPHLNESESEYLLSQYCFTRKFVLRCTVSDIINNNNLTRLQRLKIHETQQIIFTALKSQYLHKHL